MTASTVSTSRHRASRPARRFGSKTGRRFAKRTRIITRPFPRRSLIEVDGQPQAVVPGIQWFVAYDPLSGDELWRVDHGPGFSNVARPVFDGRLLFLNTGLGKAQLWAVRPDGVGDVSETHVVSRDRDSCQRCPRRLLAMGGYTW